MPQTSILIRAFNEQKHIGNLLAAIRRQRYKDYEIVLVDSGSTDRTLEIASADCDTVMHIESRNFTFGYSLNVGCENSKGEYIAIVSAHAIPRDDFWLEKLVEPFVRSTVAMVYGRHIGAQETKYSERRDFARLFDDRPRRSEAPHFYANNANSAVRRSLWREHPWDDFLTGLEDISWARHFIGKGYEVVYQPQAAVHHIHEESWHQVYNRFRREAVASRRIGLPEPPHASPKTFFFIRHLIGDTLARLVSPGSSSFSDIARFRYHQWKGAREGWTHDIDLKKERSDLFFSGANQAVVIAGRHQAMFTERPVPENKPGEVIVKVAFVGVCRTDIEIFEQELGYYKHGHANYPIVPGHEYSGEIVKVGLNSNGLSLHDRVVGEVLLPCGRCECCRRGELRACSNRREVGVVNLDGAYSTFVAVPSSSIHKIPNHLDLRTACLAEPLAVVKKGLRRADKMIRGSGEKSAVIGAGPIGNLCAQALKLAGHDVTVFDMNPSRLEYLPADIGRSTQSDDLTSFGLIVEATGHVGALRTVLTRSRADSTILLLGFPYGEIQYNFENVVAADRTIIGSVGAASEDFRWAIETLPKLDTEPFTRMVLPLRQYAQAWDLHRSGRQLKVLLNVAAEG